MSETSAQKPLQRPGTFHQEHSRVYVDPRTPNPWSTQKPDSTVKRLIVLCDGTWKSSDSGQPEYATNVTLLSRALDCVDQRTGSDIQQIVYYQAGLGSGELLETQYLAAGAIGFGLDNNVRECYAYLASNYQRGCRDEERQAYTPDDEIFLFGFSRGAYTVRALAGFISQVGLLTKRGMNDFAEIYTQYKKGPDSFKKYTDKRTAASPDKIPWEAQRGVTIKAMTIMDCVGSIGFPQNSLLNFLGWNKGFGFYDTSLVPGIENAFHALALDEKRAPFTPTLFHIPHQKPGDEKPRLTLTHTNSFPNTLVPDKRVNLVQTWFCGVHSNVGGGYKNHKQSDVVLAWIIDHMQPLLKFDQSYLDIICAQTEHDTKLVRILDNEASLWDRFMSTFWPPSENSSVAFKGTSSWWIGDIYDSYTGIFHLTRPKPRTPGQYKPGCVTNERIHPSVRHRYDNDKRWKKQCIDSYKMKPFQDPKTQKWHWEIGGTSITIEEEDVLCHVDNQTQDSMQIQLAGKEEERAQLKAWLRE